VNGPPGRPLSPAAAAGNRAGVAAWWHSFPALSRGKMFIKYYEVNQPKPQEDYCSED